MSLLQLPSAKYYADDAETFGPVPTLSQSVAHTLLSQSPLHAYRAHPRLGNVPKEPTPAMIRGTLIHQLLLEEHENGLLVLDFKDYATKAAQQARIDTKAAGLQAVLVGEMKHCRAAVAAIREQLAAQGIRFVGQSERVAVWTETADDGTPVPCRGLFDHWLGGTILDLKTTGCAHPDDIQRSYIKHGYDIQAAAYRSAAAQLFPELAKTLHFVNIFAEVEEPFQVLLVIPDADMLSLGSSRWRRAVNLWPKCLRENKWPGYATEPISLSPPKWAVDREFDSRLETFNGGY